MLNRIETGADVRCFNRIESGGAAHAPDLERIDAGTEAKDFKRPESEPLVETLQSVTNAMLVKGFSPYIGENGHWFVFDAKERKFIDSGVNAAGGGGGGETIYIENPYDDTEVRGLIDGKQDRLTPGANISIKDGVISATGSGFVGIATRDTLGTIIVGDNLNITESGVLSVDTASDISEDNTRPATSAQVYTQLGNIAALLATI